MVIIAVLLSNIALKTNINLKYKSEINRNEFKSFVNEIR